MKTRIYETTDATKYEFRPTKTNNFKLECRLLKNDGHAYDDNWYPVDSEWWGILVMHSPEIIRDLVPGMKNSQTMTPRG